MFMLALPQLATPPSAMVLTDQVFSYFCRGLPNNSKPIYAYISIFFRAYSHFCQIICNSNIGFRGEYVLSFSYRCIRETGHAPAAMFSDGTHLS